MTWDTASKIAIAVLAALAAITHLSFWGTFTRRVQIKRDTELLRLLPAGTATHGRLLQHIDRSLARLAAEEDKQTLDRVGMVLGFAYLLVAGVMATLAAQGAGWGWIPAATLAVLSLASFADAWSRAQRDESDMLIAPAPSSRGETGNSTEQHFGYMVLISSDGLIQLKDDKIYADLGQAQALISAYQAAEGEDSDRYSIAVIVPLRH